MSGFSTVEPSITDTIQTAVAGEQVSRLQHKSVVHTVIKATNSVISSLSTATNSPPSSSSGNANMLFTWVFIACVVLALLLLFAIFMVVLCWNIKRRRRTATVTHGKKGEGKCRQRGRVSLRNSIKRVFVSDGPLYAVSNLSGSRYTGIPERQNNPNSDSARSSPTPQETISPDVAGTTSNNNPEIVYQRYLSPIEGVPPPSNSVSPITIDRQDHTYLQPIDELRASKRFLQRSRNGSPVPDDTAYLEPLHGIPIPDDPNPKTSTPKTSAKPSPSPKPAVKPKPS